MYVVNCLKVMLLSVLLPSTAVMAETARFPHETEPDEAGFFSLFNGEDLTGWEIFGNEEDFQVKDGLIRSETGQGGHILYYTAHEFSDFILRVEWRVAKNGNSGVFIRSQKDDAAPWINAYEIQISSEVPPRENLHCTGSLYGFAAVEPRPDETPEIWRSYEITCKGTHITVEVDGIKVIDFDQDSSDETREKALSGHIGIQDSHGPAGTWVEYRKIAIKPLD